MSNSERTFRCTCCHDDFPLTELINFNHTDLCSDCFEQETTTCDVCGERIWSDDSISDDDTDLCERCYENHYTRCDHCDRLIRYDEACYLDDDDDIPYCSSCIEQIGDRCKAIQSYFFKPNPVFHGTGKRFMGVELEIDRGGESQDNAWKLLDIANANSENLYVKHDGSLDDGIELVIHPMTLEYHTNQMPWERVVNEAVQMGYRSHQTSTCGLHVHVNRSSLGDTSEQQDETIGRILFFVENHWSELLKFSRRSQSQMDQWAARYGRKDSPKEQLDHVKSSYSGRYKAVNLLNSATIEFRLFRGTLRYTTLIATLQLVYEICEVALFLSDEEMSRLLWSEFVARIGELGHDELVQYLKERRLYVSEPVCAEEEEV